MKNCPIRGWFSHRLRYDFYGPGFYAFPHQRLQEELEMSLEMVKELVTTFALAGFIFQGFMIGRLRDRVSKLEAELDWARRRREDPAISVLSGLRENQVKQS
jgi:hypothetical protein